MYVSPILAGLPLSFSFHLGSSSNNNTNFTCLRARGVPFPFRSPKPRLSSLNHNQCRRFCSLNGDNIDVHGLSDTKSCSPQHEVSTEKSASGRGVLPKSNETVKKLKRYGIAGLLSYGLLNTVYYLMTFLLVWFYVAPAPGKMGYLAAVKRFLKIMAMVWAGSQVTKILRAGGNRVLQLRQNLCGRLKLLDLSFVTFHHCASRWQSQPSTSGALALAPFVDRGLSWFTVKFKFESQGKAFMAIIAVCLGLAVLLFFFVTLLWA